MDEPQELKQFFLVRMGKLRIQDFICVIPDQIQDSISDGTNLSCTILNFGVDNPDLRSAKFVEEKSKLKAEYQPRLH